MECCTCYTFQCGCLYLNSQFKPYGAIQRAPKKGCQPGPFPPRHGHLCTVPPRNLQSLSLPCAFGPLFRFLLRSNSTISVFIDSFWSPSYLSCGETAFQGRLTSIITPQFVWSSGAQGGHADLSLLHRPPRFYKDALGFPQLFRATFQLCLGTTCIPGTHSRHQLRGSPSQDTLYEMHPHPQGGEQHQQYRETGLGVAHCSDTGGRVHDIGRSVPLSTLLERPLPFLRTPIGKKAVNLVLARLVLMTRRARLPRDLILQAYGRPRRSLCGAQRYAPGCWSWRRRGRTRVTALLDDLRSAFNKLALRRTLELGTDVG